jgi:hypothetical protein
LPCPSCLPACSNTSAKFYGEITQQMLKNSSFPGSNNGTGLFQTIVGLKVGLQGGAGGLRSGWAGSGGGHIVGSHCGGHWQTEAAAHQPASKAAGVCAQPTASVLMTSAV